MFRIVIPTDFSEASRAAFSPAMEQARMRGVEACQVLLVCVLEDLVPASVQFEFGLTLFDSKTLLDEAEKQATLRLASYASEYFSGVAVQSTVLRGTKSTATEIAEFADQSQASLLVLASHGRSGLKRFALGSITENVLRHVSCPTLVIPRRDV